MNNMLRVLMGAGLFIFGYYLGRGVSRNMAMAGQTHDSHSARARARVRKADVDATG
ncbi:MAG: hypothetical protein WBP44_11870 [Gammaproteobacteria bacterium]|jgi:hypothetical protein